MSSTGSAGDAGVRYEIDAQDRISFVDDRWGSFAEANDGPELTRNNIIGRVLWSQITDATTLALYQKIVAHAREGRASRFRLRCDGVEDRRLLEMNVSGNTQGHVTFETDVVWQERRPPVSLLSRSVPRSINVLRMCAWCNKVDVSLGSDEWVEIEEAVRRLKLFELEQMPQLTHGICEACLEKVLKVID